MTAGPGRICPVSYGYGAETLRRAPELRAETLWVVGGLYGNTLALDALLQAYAADRGHKALVFNGDFHWFDVDTRDFELVNDTALAFHAIRGNVETELAAPGEGAGCGCGYPEWVGDATVEHSNRIIERLRETAGEYPDAMRRLAELPMHLVAEVGRARVGIVHGDADSLAGWGFSQETLATRDGYTAAQAAFTHAAIDVFASSHTCLPVLQSFETGVLINNGAAGMPNFRGATFGLATRISTRPHKDALYGIRRSVFIEAIPLRYDARAWHKRFLAQWPAESHAYDAYWERIVEGPPYSFNEALRLQPHVAA